MAEGNTPPKALTLEEMEALLRDKEAALAEKEAELAAKDQQISNLKQGKDPNDFTGVPIPGTFKLKGEAANGKKVELTYQFKPGRVNCLLENGTTVPSAALLQLANDEKLDEEVAKKNPALLSLGAQGARDWLTHLITVKKATFLVQVTAMLLLLLCSFAAPLQAQVGLGFNQNFWKDTIKNQDTVYFNITRTLNDNAVLDAIWQFSYAGISGTPVLYIQIQERSINHANAWSIVSTDTINASKKTVWRRFEPKGTEQRVFIRSPSGSQQTRPLGMVRYFRKYVFP